MIKLTLSGDEIATSASGTLAAISDANSNVIADVTDLVTPKPNPMAVYTTGDVAPGQTPTIKSAMIVSPTEVKIEFSETITALDDTDNITTVTDYVTFYKNNDRIALSGGTAEIGTTDDADTITITFTPTSGSTIVFAPSDTGRVTITNDIVSATNDGTGGSGSGDTLLKFKGVKEYPVEAGQIPTVESVKITGPEQVTVTFSEPVYAMTENFTKFTLTGGMGITVGETRTLSSGESSENPATNYTEFTNLTGDTLDDYKTFTMVVSGDNLPTDATGTVRIDNTVDDDDNPISLRDTDGIEVSRISSQVVSDGQNPNLISAKLTTPKEITIKFTEAIMASWPDFTDLMVNGVSKGFSGIIGSTDNTMTSIP